MSKRYSGKSFKDSSVMKKPKLTFKEKRKLKEEKKKEKCIKKGAMAGGQHGDEYMPQFLNFFKENLL